MAADTAGKSRMTPTPRKAPRDHFYRDAEFEIPQPTRRDALAKPVRFLDKYKNYI